MHYPITLQQVKEHHVSSKNKIVCVFFGHNILINPAQLEGNR